MIQCSICGKPAIKVWSAHPVTNGICCDQCHRLFVITARQKSPENLAVQETKAVVTRCIELLQRTKDTVSQEALALLKNYQDTMLEE